MIDNNNSITRILYKCRKFSIDDSGSCSFNSINFLMTILRWISLKIIFGGFWWCFMDINKEMNSFHFDQFVLYDDQHRHSIVHFAAKFLWNLIIWWDGHFVRFSFFFYFPCGMYYYPSWNVQKCKKVSRALNERSKQSEWNQWYDWSEWYELGNKSLVHPWDCKRITIKRQTNK